MDVLLVEADEGERFRLSEALERQGCRVVSCPGPLGPGYTCVGGRTGRCPLVDPADVIVLDLWLPGDDLIMGTTPLELLSLYASSGAPVVALGRSGFARELYGEGRVTFLPRHPDADELLQAHEDAMATR
ncbi:MAG: hypothetical protein M3P10_01205 [Actinomycetota bacterium]|nr:hypothetical protein [Actinomycetota bacterium]